MSSNGVDRVGRSPRECRHTPPCPSAQSGGRLAARVICGHLDQGWELLCNGIVVFDDAGALLPDGRTLAPAVVRMPTRFAATA